MEEYQYAQANNTQSQGLSVLSLPTELILLIIAHLPLPEMLAFAGTVKRVKLLVYEEILNNIKEYDQWKAQDHYQETPLIKYNLNVLKLKYQKLHHDYNAYCFLQTLAPQEQLRTAANQSEYKKIFLRYPIFYKAHLLNTPEFSINIYKDCEDKKFLSPICELVELPENITLLQLLTHIKENDHQLPLMKYFAQQLVGSNDLSSSYCLKALEIIQGDTSNFNKAHKHDNMILENIAKDFSEVEISRGFSTDEQWVKACQEMYKIYNLLKAILDGCSQNQEDRQKLCEQLKTQAQAKLSISVPEQTASSDMLRH